MILFDEKIVQHLNQRFSGREEYVESVLLASYGFKIQFVSFDVQCNERVFATLGGVRYEWNDAPNSGPWGTLGRQVAKSAALKNSTLLSIAFQSGDSVEVETVEGRYESVIFSFASQGHSLTMEIF